MEGCPEMGTVRRLDEVTCAFVHKDFTGRWPPSISKVAWKLLSSNGRGGAVITAVNQQQVGVTALHLQSPHIKHLEVMNIAVNQQQVGVTPLHLKSPHIKHLEVMYIAMN